MKKLVRYCSHSLVLFSLISAAALRADDLVLKSGEKITGEVLSETETSITIEYNLTPKIKDSRVVSKADIQSLVRLTPAQKEMAKRQLKEILPTPDLLTAGDYEALIQEKLRTFIALFPGTPEAVAAEGIIKELTDEKTKASSGQLKVEGKWLEAEQVQKEAYAIDAYRIRLAMNKMAGEMRDDRYARAFREFEKLRQNFPASKHYVKGLSEAVDYLALYEKQLASLASEQPLLAKRRADGLKSLVGSEATTTKNAIDAEVAEFQARYAAQKTKQEKWMDVYRFDAESIKAAQDAVAKEKAFFKTLDIKAVEEQNTTFSRVVAYIAEERLEDAIRLFGSVPKNVVVDKNAHAQVEKMIAQLEKDVQKKRRMETASVVKEAASAPSDTKPADDKGEAANPLAEALRKAQEGKQPAPEDKKPEPAPKTDAAPAASAPVEQEGGSFTDYIPYVGGLLVVVLLAALALSKRKKKEDDELA